MATVYVSYKSEDKYIVNLLVPLLEEKGHKIRFDQELPIGAAWRDQLMGALLSSDVVLVLWTENTHNSQFVPAEVGAVRASPKLGLLPVVIGDVSVPPFIQDLIVERIPNTDPETLRKLSEKLDASIRKHIEYRNLRKKGRPKIFISHRHKDEEIVRSLVDCIKTYFHIDRQDIRCTSVRPYRLPVGENTSDRLRDEITDAEVVLGILTTDMPLSRRFQYPLQTGVGILTSARPPRLHEPWHSSEGVWYSWETLEGWQHWLRRQKGEPFSVVPEDGQLLLFVSHRWESLDHPDPIGRQLKAVRIGLTMALAASLLSSPQDSTGSGLPQLFARYLAMQGLDPSALRPWAEDVRSAATATSSEDELLEKLRGPSLNQTGRLLEDIRRRVLIWYDYASMYQSPRNLDQEASFRVDITRLNEIQAGAATLVLAENEDYTRRAWCFLEICGGVRGLLVEVTPSWGRNIGAYNGIQRWGYISDQIIGALITHGTQVIQGSGLSTTHDSDLPIVADLIARLPLFGLVASSGSDLIGGSIPVPLRDGRWVFHGYRAKAEKLLDGPPVEFGCVPDLKVLEWARVATANVDRLKGGIGMWIYTSQRVLSLAWATRAAEWKALAGIEGRLDGVACTWADSCSLADDGRGWTRYVPSQLDTLIIVTQADLDKICLLLDFVVKAHVAAGTTIVTVMPDTGQVSVERPDKDRTDPEGVEADILVVPRIRRYTAYPQYLTRSNKIELTDMEAMAALRLDPSEGDLRWESSRDVVEIGMRRVSAEALARLTTASWEVYARPRLNTESWRDVEAALSQLDLIVGLVQHAARFSSNPFECRTLIYELLHSMDLTGNEPLTQEVLDRLSQIVGD